MRAVRPALRLSSKSCFEEIVLACAASLDLDEVGGRKDRAEETEIEDVGAVVAGGHHADGHADTRLAGLVGWEEVAEPSRLLLVKLMVNCWASGICEVTCTAKSD